MYWVCEVLILLNLDFYIYLSRLKVKMNALLRILVEFCILALCYSWKEWNYTVKWSHAGSANTAENNKIAWEAVWNINGSFSDVQAPPPRPRRGHSLHIIKTNPLSTEYNGHTYLVMFGGRDNDQETKHIPKTYEVKNVSLIPTFLLDVTNDVFCTGKRINRLHYLRRKACQCL